MEQESKDAKTVTSRRAQTASELAIFGAIIIFIIGVIVRSGMSASQIMNQQLKAMRLALTWSYNSSIARGKAGFTSRNVANIVVVEDRLSIDVGSKLGTRDRVPMMYSGSATMSNQLFQSIYYGEHSNLAIYDLFVNGQHFPLITAKFKPVSLCANHPTAVARCYDTNAAPGIQGPGGCVLFYKIAGNYKASKEWCARGCTKNLPEDERYDLDHSDTTFCPGCSNGADVPDDLRNNTQASARAFSWQWVVFPNFRKDSENLTRNILGPGETALNLVGIPVKSDDDDTEEIDEGGHIDDVFDVDGDGKEEIVHDVNCSNNCAAQGSSAVGEFSCVRVTDSQEGDVDFTFNDRDAALGFKPPGMEDDVQMFSFTRGVGGGTPGNPDGTYLRVEEGQLFDPADGRFMRSTNRQNHVDIIQRIFRLSHNTGRFCSGGVPTCWPGDPGGDVNCPFGGLYDPRGDVAGRRNPVEACNECFLPDKVALTCLDTTHKLIFIRSRIADMRGRRWVTKGLD